MILQCQRLRLRLSHSDIVCQKSVFGIEEGSCGLDICFGVDNIFLSANDFFIVFALIACLGVCASSLKFSIASNSFRFFESFPATALFQNDIAMVLESGRDKAAL